MAEDFKKDIIARLVAKEDRNGLNELVRRSKEPSLAGAVKKYLPDIFVCLFTWLPNKALSKALEFLNAILKERRSALLSTWILLPHKWFPNSAIR
jgi:hypothetical protein